MGKKHKRRNGGGGRDGGKPQGGKPRGPGWVSNNLTIDKNKDNLENYYNDLVGLTTDAEKEEFWGALRRELPNSFRFCGSKGHALSVQKLLKERYIPEITTITNFEGQLVEPPQPVAWFPDGLAWWMTTPKNVVRKHPPFAKFQKFLVSETSVGNISRQEVVSMIPPLLLDVRPGMAVLDLCAAPGSKSAQLLEMIHIGEEGRVRKVLQDIKKQSGVELSGPVKAEEDVDMAADPSDDGRATGVLIANDADYKRCHMLVHQLKRLSSPNLIVTNHDATLFPGIQIPSEDPKKRKYLKFDRILADVPCSGDGTLRKNANLWKDWAPINALNLHVVQVRILVKALQMLKPGGRVVYSTCSMNPVENESVISSAIDRCGGTEKIEILDCSNELPGLKRVPGMSKWKIIDKSDRVWSSWKEVEEFAETTADKATPAKLIRGMFPPAEDFGCPDIPFERCMRVYAHQQDTGGFFITALRKKAEFRAKPAEAKAQQEVKPKSEAVQRIYKEEDGQSSNDTATPNNEQSAAPTPAQETVPSATNGNGETTKRPLEDAEDEAGPSKRIKAEVAAADITPAAEPGVKEDTAADTTPAAKIDIMEENDQKPSIKAEEAVADTTPAADAEIKEEEGDDQEPAADMPRRKDGGWEEPFKYIAPDHETIQNIKTFYDLSPRFPDDRYMVRNATCNPTKGIYYTSGLVRDILTSNDGKGVKFISAGVKMYVKQDAPSAEVCKWRIQSEGMPILQGYVGENRIVRLHSKETLRKLLVEMFPKFIDGHSENMGEIGERIKEVGMGCCVLRIEPKEGDRELESMAIPLWKSFHSVNLMLPKEDRAAMLLRIFNEVTPLINNGLAKNKPVEAAKTEEADVKIEDALALPASEATGKEDGDATAKVEGAAEDATMDDVVDAPAP